MVYDPKNNKRITSFRWGPLRKRCHP